MEDRGEIISIKFSPDKRILAAQRSIKTVVCIYIFFRRIGIFLFLQTYHVISDFFIAFDPHSPRQADGQSAFI